MTSLFRAALAATALALGAAGAADAGVVTFSGFDVDANAPGVNAKAAAAAFDAAVAGASLITFESDPPAGLTLSGGGTITSTPEGSPLSFYGGNTTVGGSKFLDLYGVDETFTFATPISAFGAFIGGGQFAENALIFTDANGAHSISLGPDSLHGGYAFVGFSDAGQSITSITIAATRDIIAADDVRFLSNAAGPAPTPGVPEPASWALMISGFGLAGAMLRRRRGLAPA